MMGEIDEDKIVPFTELNYEQMEKTKEEIFQPKFLKLMEFSEDELLNYANVIKNKILDYIMELLDKEKDDPHKIVWIYLSILYGIHDALTPCYFGLKIIEGGFHNLDKDKVK